MSTSFLLAARQRAADASSSSCSSSCVFEDLPAELLAAVLFRLPLADLVGFSAVSQSWRHASSSACFLWHSILGQETFDDVVSYRSLKWTNSSLNQKRAMRDLFCSQTARLRRAIGALAPLCSPTPLEQASETTDAMARASCLRWPLLVPLSLYRPGPSREEGFFSSLESEAYLRCAGLPTGVKSRWDWDAVLIRGPEQGSPSLQSGYPWLLPHPWSVRLVGYAMPIALHNFNRRWTAEEASVLLAKLTHVLTAAKARDESVRGVGLGELPGFETWGAGLYMAWDASYQDPRIAVASVVGACEAAGFTEIVLAGNCARCSEKLLRDFRAAGAITVSTYRLQDIHQQAQHTSPSGGAKVRVWGQVSEDSSRGSRKTVVSAADDC